MKRIAVGRVVCGIMLFCVLVSCASSETPFEEVKMEPPASPTPSQVRETPILEIDQVPVSMEEDEAEHEESWRYFRNQGILEDVQPRVGGDVYFRFRKGTGETAMDPTDNYYYVPADHGNYAASIALLYLAARTQWRLYVSTEGQLDPQGYAVVDYLFLSVPMPESASAAWPADDDPWVYFRNQGYIKNLYPCPSGRFYFRFWRQYGVMSMDPRYDYYYVSPNDANYEASVDLLLLAAEMGWRVEVGTEQELDPNRFAVVEHLYVPVFLPESASGPVEDGGDYWGYTRNNGYIKHLYPDSGGKLYFRFWAEYSETDALRDADHYYYIPPDHDNFRASADLLYLAARSEWRMHAETVHALDEADHAQVAHLFLPVPEPSTEELLPDDFGMCDGEGADPWGCARNRGYIQHLYPAPGPTMYIGFWAAVSETAMAPDPYYYLPGDYGNYQIGVDLLSQAAESRWPIYVSTEPELDASDHAIVTDLRLLVPDPEVATPPIEIEEGDPEEDEAWGYLHNYGYIKGVRLDSSGELYFWFWDEGSETAMEPLMQTYFLPAAGPGFEACVSLLSRAAESQWRVYVHTEPELDEEGRVVVEYLSLSIP